jgi:hypothetical protein
MIKKYRNLEWGELGFWEKAKLFSKWSIVSLIGNILLIIGTVLQIMSKLKNMTTAEIFLGFGCMLTWVSFSRYIESASQYTFISRTLLAALPVVMRTMIGIFPFFIGFAFLGLCLFWDSIQFNSPSSAMFTLFSLMNGDSISDVYTDITYQKFLFGNLYMYTFVFISIW